MPTERETIPLLVTLGFPADESLNLRFPPEYREELGGLLDEHGIDHGMILEFSAGVDLAIEAAKVLQISGGLAAVVGLAAGNSVGMTVAGGLLLLAVVRVSGAATLTGVARVGLTGLLGCAAGAGIARLVTPALTPSGVSLVDALIAGMVAALVSGLVFVVVVGPLNPSLVRSVTRAVRRLA